MQRRDDIRAAMQSLLAPARRPEAASRPDCVPEPAAPGRPAYSPAQERMLGEIQATLGQHGIAAELHEIADMVLESLAARPGLCRGLFAAQFLAGAPRTER